MSPGYEFLLHACLYVAVNMYSVKHTQEAYRIFPKRVCIRKYYVCMYVPMHIKKLFLQYSYSVLW